MSRLTDAVARRISGRGFHPDGGGLYLAVRAQKDGGPSRSWVCRYTAPDGRRREAGLGRYADVSLARARALAAELREAARKGADPLAERDAKRARAALEAARAISFEVAAKSFVVAHQAGWSSEKHRKQWLTAIRQHVFPIFGSVPVADIDSGLVLRALEPIWATKTESASGLRQRIEKILDWATVRGYRSGPNPAAWKGRLQMALPGKSAVHKVAHHAALQFQEMPRFWRSLSQRTGVGADALRFLILTAARSREVRGALWGESDLAGALWIVPAARMKAKREHRVPLSEEAVSIIRARQGGKQLASDLVFASDLRLGSTISDMTITAVLRRMDLGELTAHGFRSTFRDWAGEATTFPCEVAEAALAHRVGDAVELAYRRCDALEKRRDLMNAWASYCLAAADCNAVS